MSDQYKGPWSFDGDCAIRDKNGALVAGLWGDDGQFALIAAAPDLLAALKQVRSELRAVGFISGQTQDAADAAIAKAEGQV